MNVCGVKAFPGSESGPSATWSTPRTCSPRTEGVAPAGYARPAPGENPSQAPGWASTASGALLPPCLPPSMAALWCGARPGGEPGSWLPWLQDAGVQYGPAALLGSWWNHSGDAPPRAQGWWVPTGWTPAPTEQTQSTRFIWLLTPGRRCLAISRLHSISCMSGPFCSLIFQILLPFECELLPLSCLLSFFWIRVD